MTGVGPLRVRAEGSVLIVHGPMCGHDDCGCCGHLVLDALGEVAAETWNHPLPGEDGEQWARGWLRSIPGGDSLIRATRWASLQVLDEGACRSR